MKVIALASIEGSSKDAAPIIAPKTVFDLDGDKLKRLLEARAVREATEDEITIAKARGDLLSPKGEVVEPTAAEVKAAQKAEADAAKKAAAAQAEADKKAKAAEAAAAANPSGGANADLGV